LNKLNRSTQPSILWSNLAGVKVGAHICVGWQITLWWSHTTGEAPRLWARLQWKAGVWSQGLYSIK